jgi:hypothetical protein
LTIHPDTLRVHHAIEHNRKALEDELGTFLQEDLPTPGRVLLRPQNELPHVAYMSDGSPDARLVIDDYVPELGDPTMDPNFPSDDQEGI